MLFFLDSMFWQIKANFCPRIQIDQKPPFLKDANLKGGLDAD